MTNEDGSLWRGHAQTTAYLVSSGDYSSYGVHRVFLDRADAEAFISRENARKGRRDDSCDSDGLEVEERPLGAGPHPDSTDPRLPAYGVVWSARGPVWAGPVAAAGHLAHVVKMVETYHHPREPRYDEYYSIYDLPEAERLEAVAEKQRRQTSTPRVAELSGLIDEEFWNGGGSQLNTPWGVDAVAVDRSLQDHPDWGGWISADAVSFKDQAHAEKMWYDARSQVLADLAGL